jgi:tRNA U34 5-methylaminomethyl-2-thiouridine-forming methyltransferase MnmC
MFNQNEITDILEAIKEANTNAYEAARTMGELNLSTWEKLAEKQIEAFNICFDAGVEMLKASSAIKDVKDVKELVNAEVVRIKAVSEKLVANSKDTLEVANAASVEYRSLVETNVESFTNKVNEAAKKAA